MGSFKEVEKSIDTLGATALDIKHQRDIYAGSPEPHQDQTVGDTRLALLNGRT